MNMSFHDKSPIYRQLSEQLKDLILEGVFSDGDGLPSVRQISAEQHINPITVSKAFQLLVDDGLVEKRRGLGMFVGEGAQSQLREQERRSFLESDWPAFRAKAEKLGYSVDQLLQVKGERT